MLEEARFRGESLGGSHGDLLASVLSTLAQIARRLFAHDNPNSLTACLLRYCLNSFTELNVEQLRTALNTIYVREGQAIQHNYASQGLLILDSDFTGLPASKQAEGSRKGSLSGKKGGVDGNGHG